MEEETVGYETNNMEKNTTVVTDELAVETVEDVTDDHNKMQICEEDYGPDTLAAAAVAATAPTQTSSALTPMNSNATIISSIAKQCAQRVMIEIYLTYLAVDEDPLPNCLHAYRAFKQKYPDSNATFAFFRRIFKKKFPSHPEFYKTYSCRICNATNTVSEERVTMHMNNVEQSAQQMEADIQHSRRQDSDVSCIIINYQPVIVAPVVSNEPTLICHSRNSVGMRYNDKQYTHVYTWTKELSGTLSNDIASCLLDFLLTRVTSKNIIIWSHNRLNQLKNKIILFVYLYLIATDRFDRIEHKFLETGHQRDGEVQLNQLRDYSTTKHGDESPGPLEVINMEDCGFWNVKKAAESLVLYYHFKLSQITVMRFDKEDFTTIKFRYRSDDTTSWQSVNIVRKKTVKADIVKALQSTYVTYTNRNGSNEDEEKD